MTKSSWALTDYDDDDFVVVAGKMLTWSEHQQHQTSIGEMMSMSLLVDQCAAGVFCTMMIGASLYVDCAKVSEKFFFVFVCSVKIFFVWRRNATSRGNEKCSYKPLNCIQSSLFLVSADNRTTTTTGPMPKRFTSPAFRASPPACVLSVPVKFYLSGGWADQNSLHRSNSSRIGSMSGIDDSALTHHEPQL